MLPLFSFEKKIKINIYISPVAPLRAGHGTPVMHTGTSVLATQTGTRGLTPRD